MKKDKGLEISKAISILLESYAYEDSMNCIIGLASATVHYLGKIKETTESNVEDGVERIFLNMLKTGDDLLDMNFREYINTDGLHKMRESIMLDTVVRVMGLIRRGVINPRTKNIEIRLKSINQPTRKCQLKIVLQ